MMELSSLGRITDLIFNNFWGKVTYRKNYILIQTPTNPRYYWGNYIIFKTPPQKGDLKKWKDIFDQEFSSYSTINHYAFTWNSQNNDSFHTQEFLDEKFDLERIVVLKGNKPKKPQFFNDDLSIRKLISKKDWELALKNQILSMDKKFQNEDYIIFKSRQMKDYYNMYKAKKGFWYGAFLGEELVGDLGVFYQDKIGRYQNVGTHPNHRRKGICGTLVYETFNLALKEFELDFLVMEADLDYHAARIYESVGFKKNEINYSLSWWKSKK